MSGDAYPHHASAGRRHGAHRVMSNAITDAGIKPEQVRIHQRAWHVDAAERSHRNHGDQTTFRRSCAKAGGQFDKIDDRASSRRRRRRRSRYHVTGCPARDHSSDDQLRNARSRIAISITCRTRRVRRMSGMRCRIPSGSVAPTLRSSSKNTKKISHEFGRIAKK